MCRQFLWRIPAPRRMLHYIRPIWSDNHPPLHPWAWSRRCQFELPYADRSVIVRVFIINSAELFFRGIIILFDGFFIFLDRALDDCKIFILRKRHASQNIGLYHLLRITVGQILVVHRRDIIFQRCLLIRSKPVSRISCKPVLRFELARIFKSGFRAAVFPFIRPKFFCQCVLLFGAQIVKALRLLKILRIFRIHCTLQK